MTLFHLGSLWRRRLVRAGLVLACVAVVPFTGCGGGGDEEESAASAEAAAKAPYGPVSRETVNQYKRNRNDGTTLDIVSEVVGDKTIDGKTFWRAKLGDFNASAPSGMEAWVVFPNPDAATFAGGDFWSQQILPNPNAAEPSASVALAEPIDIDLNPTVGTEQTITATATVTLLGQPVDVDVSGSYTMVSDDESIQTEAGVLNGCRKFTGSGTATNSEILSLLGADQASGDLWYHPSLGVVRAVIKVPGKDDYVFDFMGTTEMGKATSGVNRVQGMRVLHTLERFELSTYDARGEFDADKDKHAKMLVEARFMDDEKAKTSDRPPIETEIGTVFGVYPHQLVASPVSFFHPEENGKGFTFWIAYVDQAAKNESSNGIAYHVNAIVPDYGSSPVRVTSRIVYTIYKP